MRATSSAPSSTDSATSDWTPPDLDLMRALARQYRVDSVRAAAAAGSGHPTSSMSAAELVAVLLAGHFRYDLDDPDDPGRDHLVFSKGHASPLLYAGLRSLGLVDDDELLTFRKEGSRLEGHPTPAAPLVDAATGSLGQGLAVGFGLALAARRLEASPSRVWVLSGDSEMTEGSVWEAAEAAAAERLGNLVLLVDVNRLGQTGPTRHGWDLDHYARRLAALGWRTAVVDGHDVDAIDRAYDDAAASSDAPTAVIARTEKGHGASETADEEGAHGKPLDRPEEAIEEMGGLSSIKIVPRPIAEGGPSSDPRRDPRRGMDRSLPSWPLHETVATRDAFGEALAALVDSTPELVVIDGEVKNSTRTASAEERDPDRFVEAYIAEQLMIGAAVGLQARGWRPVAATFAAFLTRAHDFLRMATVGRADIGVVGSHAGVSIGEDGPSQMGLEDIAMMRALHGAVVLHPCDANQTAQLTPLLVERPGITYLRTIREDTPMLYRGDEGFHVGGSRVVRRSDDDVAVVVAAGVTVHEAIAAAELLQERGTSIAVIDAYSIEPIDEATVRGHARRCGAVVTVEDHRPAGGLGDAVVAALATQDANVPTRRLAVRDMPGSAPPVRQRARAGIDHWAIADAVEQLVALDR